MSIDMTSKVQFKIHHGEEGHIEFSPNCKILQSFIILTSNIDMLDPRKKKNLSLAIFFDKLEERTFRSVY
jgi:hypothetical protein